jgi:hypothetical protein
VEILGLNNEWINNERQFPDLRVGGSAVILTEEQRAGEFLMTTPVGEQRAFEDLIEVAQRATSNAVGE